MTSAFSWPCFILYSKAKFACYSRYFLTSYFAYLPPVKCNSSQRQLKNNLYYWREHSLFDQRSFAFTLITMSCFLPRNTGINICFTLKQIQVLNTKKQYDFLFMLLPRFHFPLLRQSHSFFLFWRVTCSRCYWYLVHVCLYFTNSVQNGPAPKCQHFISAWGTSSGFQSFFSNCVW